MMQVFTEEQRKALIAFNEEKLKGLKFAVKQHALKSARAELQNEITSTEIALAALTAEPGLFEWRFKDAECHMPSPWTALGMDRLEQCQASFGDMVEYRFWCAAPPAPALRLPEAIEPEDVPGLIDPTAHPDEYACCVGRDVWAACIEKFKRLNATAPAEGKE